MLTANKEKLAAFFQGNTQYKVPFFQRAYVWKRENWEILWDHLTETKKRIESGNIKAEHFIGTIITKQVPSISIGQEKHELIDGQQRLTTVALLIKALATGDDATLDNLKNFVNRLLQFDDVRGQCHQRVYHSKVDRQYFNKVMTNNVNGTKSGLSNVIDCYTYFKEKASLLSTEDREKYLTIVLDKTPVISMMLSQEDDEQEIFDTINSLGVRLTTGELLKNFIFKENELESEYETYWQSVFEDNEDAIKFWNRPKTSGRIVRTNIEVCLYCFLVIKRLGIVQLEKLFMEYKSWLKDKSAAEKLAILAELKEYAAIYRQFPSGIELSLIGFWEEEKRFFHVIENLEITTIYPLVMQVYNHVFDNSERIKILNLLESYIVRRNVCQLTTKNYNNLFIQILEKWTNGHDFSYESLKQILFAFNEVTNRFPDDTEFQDAFSVRHLSNKHAGEVLFCIALKHVNTGYHDVNKLSRSNYSVEHILPKKWGANWNEPALSEADKINRNQKLLTLGNLTLVTGSLNSSMQNAAWSKKKETLKKYSSLSITTAYLSHDEWNEDKIISRSKDLYSTAKSIWPK
jgi:hypothetical protein